MRWSWAKWSPRKGFYLVWYYQSLSDIKSFKEHQSPTEPPVVPEISRIYPVTKSTSTSTSTRTSTSSSTSTSTSTTSYSGKIENNRFYEIVIILGPCKCPKVATIHCKNGIISIDVFQKDVVLIVLAVYMALSGKKIVLCTRK